MNISYMLYQAQRPRTAAEQREADVQAGVLAAGVARLARSVRHAIMGAEDRGRKGRRLAAATASCAVSRSQ